MQPWLTRAAAMHPQRVALETEERSLTYTELHAHAEDEAQALRELGVRPGQRVPLELDDRVGFAVRLHACLLIGAAAVPIDPRLGGEERAVRSTAGWAGREDAATVMYTSGTTAAPKAVELTYGNWLANALGSAVALGLDPDETWLCPLPLAHVGGLSILIRSAIYGTTVVLRARFDAVDVAAALHDPRRRITLVSLVPAMLSRLLDAGLRHPPTLRWALLGGGPIPTPLLERARQAGIPVAPTYGTTEACSQIATHGWPLPGVEVELADDAEVLVRGATVAPRTLAPDGWLHTGDLGSFDADGRLTITGRKSDTIVSGGENVAPAEVEEVLLGHRAVVDAAVFGRSDPEWGEAVVAVVVLRAGTAATAEELRAYCAQRLAAFKVPKAVGFAASLPRTASGKLLRGELR